MSEQDDQSTDEVILLELGRVVEPFDEAVQEGPDGVFDLLKRMGIAELLGEEEVEKLIEQIQGEIGEPLTTIRSELLDPLENDDLSFAEIEFVEVAGAVGDIFRGIRGLQKLSFEAVDPEVVGQRLVDFLLVSYLHDYHRATHNALSMTGVVTEGHPPEIDFSVIGSLFSDPGSAIADAMDWGEQSFHGFLITYYVHELLWRFQIPATLTEPSMGAIEDLVEFDISGGNLDSEVRIPILSAFESNTSINAGVRIVPVPGKEGTALPGLAIVPYGAANTSETFDLGNGWTFNIRASAEQADWGLLTRPDIDDKSLSAELVGNPEPTLEAAGTIAYEGEDPESETTLLGNPDASRVAVKYAGLTAKIQFDDGELTITVALPARGTIGVDPADFDGFLKKVMPEDGLFYNFDVTVGWSSETGLFFDRGGTLEVSLPQNASVGPVTMQEIWLSAGGPGGGEESGESSESETATTEGTITIAGAASAAVELGPVEASVSRMGVEADVSFPEDSGGNLGPVDLELGFKPPDGVGISIDAGAVSGGGYLELDHENNRYAGVLQLKAGDLTINAVGLLTTELPSGKDGFSLLLIISGEFPPVQLGLGFTLNGVGGLVGINRTVKAKPLGNAVRDGSMNSILFPENPVANSQRIISDLRSIFPPRAGTHVFGPMAKLGWGTPTLITADIGIILEIPTWKIVLLGRLSAVLPDEKAALIELNLAVSGILDPPNKRLAMDATLYDSRVLAWSLSGQMALRSRWGDDPRFVLSVGGFNPRFDPPSDFPELDRIKATLGPPSGNPKLEYSGYFAVTSNTFQAGAGVHLLAEAGPAKVEGRLQFDALIEFDPFYFIVDILASLTVTFKGKGLSIRLDGTLKGPGPFEIQGTIHIEILFITVSANVDVTLGSDSGDESLPAARIMPELTDELGKPGNWSAGRPQGTGNMVALRDVDTDDDTVLAHPLARIGVRQTIVPLDDEIEKFGNAQPSGYTKFSIEEASIEGSGGIELDSKTKEQFAPAQYKEMSDAEKMDSPAFTAKTAGQQIRHEGLYLGYENGRKMANVRTASLGYESSVIDRTNENDGTLLAELGRFKTDDLSAISGISTEHADALAEVSAVANSPLRTTGTQRFTLTEVEKQAHHDQLSGMASLVDSDADTEGMSDTRSGASSSQDESVIVRGGSTPDEAGVSTTMSVADGEYVIASTATLEQVEIPTVDEQPLSKSAAKRGLSRFAEAHPRQADELQVVRATKARDAPSGSPDIDLAVEKLGQFSGATQ
jgi:hypothetical protein